MTDDSQALAIEGIRFFGEMSASNSHEIKTCWPSSMKMPDCFKT